VAGNEQNDELRCIGGRELVGRYSALGNITEFLVMDGLLVMLLPRVKLELVYLSLLLGVYERLVLTAFTVNVLPRYEPLYGR